jgi:hypothetical protein
MSNFLNKLKTLVKSKAFQLYFALIAFCALVFAAHLVEHVAIKVCLFLLAYIFIYRVVYLCDGSALDWIKPLKHDKRLNLLGLCLALIAVGVMVFVFFYIKHRVLGGHLFYFSASVVMLYIVGYLFEFKSSKIFRIFMLCFALLISGFIGFVCQYSAASDFRGGVLLGCCIGFAGSIIIILQNKLKALILLLLAAATSGALGYAIGYAWAVYTREDVYVVGKNGYGPVLWKNGKLRYLSDGNFNTQATSVFVSDGNVYVAGNERGVELGPVIWKNGAPRHLPVFYADGNGAVTSVFVFGKDVYAAGYEYVRKKNTDPFLRSGFEYVQTNSAAALWKNGVPQRLSNGDGYSEAHSVYVSGNNVYVAGYEYVVEDEREVATLWINGVPQRLISDGASKAHSVFVSGSHIYVAGEENNFATLWKNGRSNLQLSDVTSCARSVYVWGNDVYVAGWEYSEWNGGIVDAMLWKNGSPQRLIAWSPRAEALSVFVK